MAAMRAAQLEPLESYPGSLCGGDQMPSELVGVAGFEPAASSSRSQRARSPTTTVTQTDLPRTVRGHPLVSAGDCGGCYSVRYSPAKDVVVAPPDSAGPFTTRVAVLAQPEGDGG